MDHNTSPQNSSATSASNTPLLYIRKLSVHARAPYRASQNAAGWDLCSAAKQIIEPGGRALIPTDLAIRVPDGTYGRIAPRSGLSLRHGIHVGAGVIDADYRGNVGVLLFNLGTSPFVVNYGDRIAQLILEKICVVNGVMEVDDLDETTRGASGFGSTGL